MLQNLRSYSKLLVASGLHSVGVKVPTKGYLFVSMEKVQVLVPRLELAPFEFLLLLNKCWQTQLVISSWISLLSSNQICSCTAASLITDHKLAVGCALCRVFGFDLDKDVFILRWLEVCKIEQPPQP